MSVQGGRPDLARAEIHAVDPPPDQSSLRAGATRATHRTPFMLSKSVEGWRKHTFPSSATCADEMENWIQQPSD